MKNEVEIDLSDNKEYIEKMLKEKGYSFVEGILEEAESIVSLIDCVNMIYKNNKGLKLLEDTLKKDQAIMKEVLNNNLKLS